ncbi:MAG TPA: head GIN domain-containing protein [Catalimonadaceae bacterium]|nr:head GIN domain-containing protein [Catalimonadaceae bacterium]HPI11691.1 head GIN domain-containing protein [Catalimonadaceae bacterium]
MKKSIGILFGALMIMSCSRSANADVFKINIDEFEEVSLRIPAEVEWVDEDMASCVLQCSAANQKLIEIAIEGKTLVIRGKEKNWNSWNLKGDDKIFIRITSSMLKKVKINGSGDFKMKSPNGSSDFEYEINGSGDLQARVSATSCKGTINGSGDVLIGGSAESFDLEIHGSGDVKALDFICSSVSVEIAGSGDAQVNASESLSVRIAGSGDVQYKGNPKKLNQKVAGSGELRKI